MATNYIRTFNNFIDVMTNRLISVGTGTATAVTALTGTFAIDITNNGPASVFYGSSNMVLGSGGFLAMYATKSFSEINDGFTIYLRADSATTVVNINEYRG